MNSETIRYRVTNPKFPPELTSLLFIEWISQLAQARLGSHGISTGTVSGSFAKRYTFTTDTKAPFKLIPEGEVWRVEIDESLDAEVVHDLIRAAEESASRGDLGDPLLYTTTLASPAPNLGDFGSFTTQFMRLLGTQKPIAGRRRLGRDVLLDFRPDSSTEDKPLFVPSTEIDVVMFIPSAGGGPFSDQVAWGTAEATRLICAFALGRPVNGPPHLFPLSDDARKAEAERDRTDETIQFLARQYIPLDIAWGIAMRGGVTTIRRILSALTAYDAAMRQSHPDVATVLTVSAIEALVVPYAPWRRDRVVRRFVNALEELCPETVG